MNKMNLSNIWTISQLKAEVKAVGSFYFSPATMRFFKSRIAPGLRHVENGIVFITSEQFDYDSPRLYTVRLMDENARVTDIDEFQQYKTLAQARKAARVVK